MYNFISPLVLHNLLTIAVSFIQFVNGTTAGALCGDYINLNAMSQANSIPAGLSIIAVMSTPPAVL